MPPFRLHRTLLLLAALSTACAPLEEDEDNFVPEAGTGGRRDAD